MSSSINPLPCQRCGGVITLTAEDWKALTAEHELTDVQSLVAGVLCADCLAGFLDWLGEA